MQKQESRELPRQAVVYTGKKKENKNGVADDDAKLYSYHNIRLEGYIPARLPCQEFTPFLIRRGLETCLSYRHASIGLESTAILLSRKKLSL